jgi:hypothetical protein
VQAAQQAWAGVALPVNLFDSALVGPAGAGFDYCKLRGHEVIDAERLTSISLPPISLVKNRNGVLANASDSESAGDEDEVELAVGPEGAEEGSAWPAADDPDARFKREVEETLLRTMQLAEDSQLTARDMTQHAVIELNALKIAGVPPSDAVGCVGEGNRAWVLRSCL